MVFKNEIKSNNRLEFCSFFVNSFIKPDNFLKFLKFCSHMNYFQAKNTINYV